MNPQNQPIKAAEEHSAERPTWKLPTEKDGLPDEVLNLLSDIQSSADAILKMMKRRKFGLASGIRNHARFILKESGSAIRCEESRRTFYATLKNSAKEK